MAAADRSGGIDGTLARGFPRSLAIDVAAAARIIPATGYAPVGEFTVGVDREQLSIPDRIYNGEPNAEFVTVLAPTARLVLHCFYTRHHDGLVRQRNLQRIIAASNLWVAAYVVRLLGEYVVEIVESIATGLSDLTVPGSDQRAVYGRLITENPKLIDLTAARVASYWNEYYRSRYHRLVDYPGQALVADLRSAGREYAGVVR